MGLLQLAVIFITLLSCMWQCYSNSSLRYQITKLKQAFPPPPLLPTIQPRPLGVESLGPVVQFPASERESENVDTSRKRTDSVSTSSKDARTMAVRRSSSASDLVSRSTGIQARLSQSDYLAARIRSGGGGEGEEGEDDMWLVSSSMSNLDSFGVSLFE